MVAMGKIREKFKGYVAVAESLGKEAGMKKEVTTAEVLRMAGISGSRFNMLVNSSLFVATCSEPRTGRLEGGGRGSAVYYQVWELQDFFMKLQDYQAQMELWNDAQNMGELEFQEKYRGVSKKMVFNGKHKIIVPDRDYLRYDVIIE